MDNKINLEIAQKLKELGVKQESEWYWGYDEDDKRWGLCFLAEPNENEYSAYTVGELGEMLPWWCKSQKLDDNTNFSCDTYEDPKSDLPWDRVIADTEANARGKMLMYLIENKLMEV